MQKKNFNQFIDTKQKVSISDIVKGNVDNLTAEYEIISLPSKGWGYPENSQLSGGELKIKLPTGKDEALLSSQNLIRKGVMIDEFLKALILDNVNYDDILIGDKNYITFAARRLAFGNNYKVKIECQKCGEEQEIDIDLSKIPIKETPELFEMDKSQTLFQFKLPVSKKIVFFKLNTTKLQNEMDQRIKAMRRPDMQVLIRTAVLIERIDDKTQFKDIYEELMNIPSRDTLTLRNYIKTLSPDIEIKHKHECKSCYRQQEVFIPITVQFFWPSNNN